MPVNGIEQAHASTKLTQEFVLGAAYHLRASGFSPSRSGSKPKSPARLQEQMEVISTP